MPYTEIFDSVLSPVWIMNALIGNITDRQALYKHNAKSILYFGFISRNVHHCLSCGEISYTVVLLYTMNFPLN